MASEMKVPSVLDVDGEPFRFKLKAMPYAIKPNLCEFERITGRTLSGIREIRDEIRKMHKAGIDLYTCFLLAKKACLKLAECISCIAFTGSGKINGWFRRFDDGSTCLVAF